MRRWNRFMGMLVMTLLVFAGSASAANSLKGGTFGINVGVGDSFFTNNPVPVLATGDTVFHVITVTGKYFTDNSTAVLLGFGFQNDSIDDNNVDADANYFGIVLGIRKYTKVDDFAPFFEGKLTYATLDQDPNRIDATLLDLSAGFGAEYFLGKQFSLEGSVGFHFGKYDDDANRYKDTYFGTRTLGLSANLYF